MYYVDISFKRISIFSELMSIVYRETSANANKKARPNGRARFGLTHVYALTQETVFQVGGSTRR